MKAEWLITYEGEALIRLWTGPIVWPGTPQWMSMEEAHALLDASTGDAAMLLERAITFAEAALDDEADPQGVVTLP